jgi:RNA-binding protein YhbY
LAEEKKLYEARKLMLEMENRQIFEKQGPIVIDGKEGIEDAVIGELLKNMAEKGEVC